jgi:hypothetical protein
MEEPNSILWKMISFNSLAQLVTTGLRGLRVELIVFDFLLCVTVRDIFSFPNRRHLFGGKFQVIDL